MAEPFMPTATLTVAVDIKSPECYLALAPTRALARDLDLDIDWLPIVTAPRRPAPEGDDRGSRHKRHRAAYRERDLARYARAAGLSLRNPERNPKRNPERSPDSSLVGAAMLAAKARSADALQAFLDLAFERYWKAELDIEDRDAVAALLREVGVANPPQASDAFTALQDSLAAAGLFDAPAYLVDEEVFFGRAHLPMIRWILGGRVGPGPI